MTKEEYDKYPVMLPLAECFLEKDVVLTYEEYMTCVEAAKEYARTHENYQFSFTKVKGFHNIQITCHQEKCCDMHWKMWFFQSGMRGLFNPYII